MVPATPNAADSISRSVPASGVVGGSAASSSRTGVADAGNREHGSTHSAAADVRSASAYDAYFSSGQEAWRWHAGLDTSPNRAPADVPTVFISKAWSPEGLTGSERLGLGGDRQGLLEKAFSVSDWNVPPSARSRPDSPLELLATDILLETATPWKVDDSGACDPGMEDEVAESPVNASARPAGLLGSPLLFDLDSLAQEAQAFLSQLEQTGQDLAGLLGRTNLLSGLVAVGLAASAIEIARRRRQRAAHAIVLQACADSTFTCYPGLGGSWSWEES